MGTWPAELRSGLSRPLWPPGQQMRNTETSSVFMFPAGWWIKFTQMHHDMLLTYLTHILWARLCVFIFTRIVWNRVSWWKHANVENVCMQSRAAVVSHQSPLDFFFLSGSWTLLVCLNVLEHHGRFSPGLCLDWQPAVWLRGVKQADTISCCGLHPCVKSHVWSHARRPCAGPDSGGPAEHCSPLM